MVMSVSFFGYGQNGQNVLVLDSSGKYKQITIYRDTTIDGWHFYKVRSNPDEFYVETNKYYKNKNDDTIRFRQPYGMVVRMGKNLYEYMPNDRWQEITEDSTHYYFQQYIKLKNKGVPDSINHWYYLLNKK